jgi:DNA-binding response OmpR family regulator
MKLQEKLSILLVEDEIQLAELMADALRQDEDLQNVIFARDGNEALYKVSNQHFDLVITDIRMPKVDGLSMLELLQKHKNHKKIPCIVISVYITEDFEKKILNLGASHILVKPFNMIELVNKSREILGITREIS